MLFAEVPRSLEAEANILFSSGLGIELSISTVTRSFTRSSKDTAIPRDDTNAVEAFIEECAWTEFSGRSHALHESLNFFQRFHILLLQNLLP